MNLAIMLLKSHIIYFAWSTIACHTITITITITNRDSLSSFRRVAKGG